MAIDQNILVTADVIIFGKGEGEQSYLLLIQRKNAPFRGQWAFPGGFVDDDERLDAAAVRELQEETGMQLKANSLQQLGAWGDPGRDPRGRTVTIAFIGKVNRDDHKIEAADDAGDVKWWPLSDLPELAFDHADILKAALKRFEAKQ